jgi:chromate transporter
MKQQTVSLWFLFWTFLKIGSTAFGGFMALISIVQTIIVERHKLMTEKEMLDGISLATLLPGPVAVNVVTYVGYSLRGAKGAFISTVGVLLPSFLLVLSVAIVYLKWGQLPIVDKLLSGFIPAVSAIILYAAWKIGHQAIKGTKEKILAIIAAILLLGVGGFYITLFIIFSSGILGWLLFQTKTTENDNILESNKTAFFNTNFILSIIFLVSVLFAFISPLSTLVQDSIIGLILTFSGMSLMLFGGGFVFIPLIQEIVVDNYNWVSQTEFITAIAMGQITPGPILISATFIGYKIHGFAGAITATFAIFFPPALLMVTASKVLDRIKHSVIIQAALKGIRAAVVGMIFAAAIMVAQTATIHWASLIIFVAVLFALFRWRVDVVWIIPVSGILGLIFY